ncbi:RHS repeat-associated core domain-containing protein [Pyruvatibacter sp.]|uniref:RHS repeat-associated core domain-containing protein n=1 Tax=Pyruvatibacter sp. TaxID=1981328 RepID=UPI0032653299
MADVDTVSPVLWFMHADHLDRPIAVTDAAGVPVSEAWLTFGDASGTSVLNARFPGQWFQSENGLHYNWHRHYDPTTGRYTQADPLGFVDGPSLYAYALNSPQMYTDPSGLAACGGLCVAALAYGGFEAASFLYDLYNLADTLTDSCASGSDIAIAGGGLALGIIAPGGGYGTLGKAGAKGIRDRLPQLDDSRKLHGDLPHIKDLRGLDRNTLTDLRDDLRSSLRERRRVTKELGADAGHSRQEAEEGNLLRSLDKLLRK